MMNQPLVSIVIPVYNAGKYLPQCLDSLIGQTYSAIEIICVNDGSTDDSLTILRHYQSLDSRLLVIDVENQGVSHARNIGIKHATGSFVLFVDADDWLDSDCVETLERYCRTNNCDVVMFPYIRERAGMSLRRTLFKGSMVLEGEDCTKLARRMIGPVGDEVTSPVNLDSYGTVWGKLYKRHVISGIEFVDLSVIGSAEDSLFNMFAFKRANVVGYCQDVFYHYRRSNNSSLTSGSIPQLKDKWHCAFRIIADNFTHEEERQALSNRIAIGSLGLLINAYKSGDYRRGIKDVLNDGLIHDSVMRFHSRSLSLKWRLFFFFVKHRMTGMIIILLYIIQFIRQV